MTISNSAVAQRFANGATTGASKSMYIDGDTVYSYGPHFPIARRIPGGYVFNSDDSSISTTKHKSLVWGEIYNDTQWELPGCEIDTALRVYAKRALSFMRAIPASRSMFPKHLELLEFNFNKAIEASEKLDQDIQPLYNVLNTDIAAKAIKRIKREGEIPDVMLAVFGKAKFLGQDD